MLDEKSLITSFERKGLFQVLRHVIGSITWVCKFSDFSTNLQINRIFFKKRKKEMKEGKKNYFAGTQHKLENRSASASLADRFCIQSFPSEQWAPMINAIHDNSWFRTLPTHWRKKKRTLPTLQRSDSTTIYVFIIYNLWYIKSKMQSKILKSQQFN